MEYKKILFAVSVLAVLGGCSSDKEDKYWKNLSNEDRQTYFVNVFAYNMMNTYYLWNEEIKTGLSNWPSTTDPKQKVLDLRYKDALGRNVDKWTQLTDDYRAFQGHVTGDTKSMGMDFALYYSDESREYVVMVVTFTYPGSPAAEAGLKRGDKIIALNGQLITPSNYATLIPETVKSENATFTFDDNSEVTLSARDMYFDPVNCYKVIEKDGIRYGYLHFTGFTLKACGQLVDVFRYFKKQAVSELVLDLRYTGGGYALTAEVMASMIVPEKELNNSSVFQREIYNSVLTEAWGEEYSVFKTDFSLQEDGQSVEISTAGANLNIEKMHVIMTGASASASESLVCGLLPYMDIDIVGQRSYGKFCGGFIVDGPSWYGWARDDFSDEMYNAALEAVDNWGIYVMVSRYADRDGNTPCMPDGFEPDRSASDDPLDGYQLGDENETMLSVVLNAGGDAAPARRRLSAPSLVKAEYQLQKPAVRINNFKR